MKPFEYFCILHIVPRSTEASRGRFYPCLNEISRTETRRDYILCMVMIVVVWYVEKSSRAWSESLLSHSYWASQGINIKFGPIIFRSCYTYKSYTPVQIFLNPPVVLPFFISRFALVRQQINSDTTGSQKKIWSS